MRILISAAEIEEAIERSGEDCQQTHYSIELNLGAVHGLAQRLNDCSNFGEATDVLGCAMAHWLRFGMAVEARRREAARLKQIMQL